MLSRHILFAICLSASTLCHGAPPVPALRPPPVVIFDNGSGASIAEETALVVPDPQVPQPKPVTIFPIQTTKARMGLLGAPVRAKLKGGPSIPICIIGDDQLSRHWLSINRDALLKMHASCLVVSVQDLKALDGLRSYAGALPLTPGSLDALAVAAGITVWPVLVTPDGMISQ